MIKHTKELIKTIIPAASIINLNKLQTTMAKHTNTDDIPSRNEA